MNLQTMKEIKKLKTPDEMFDMVCAHNYFAGMFNNNSPVDESREIFEHIKKLLINPPKDER